MNHARRRTAAHGDERILPLGTTRNHSCGTVWTCGLGAGKSLVPGSGCNGGAGAGGVGEPYRAIQPAPAPLDVVGLAGTMDGCEPAGSGTLRPCAGAAGGNPGGLCGQVRRKRRSPSRKALAGFVDRAPARLKKKADCREPEEARSDPADEATKRPRAASARQVPEAAGSVPVVVARVPPHRQVVSHRIAAARAQLPAAAGSGGVLNPGGSVGAGVSGGSG